MADPFIAEIRIFPFSFTPKGWAFCNGQLLPISQNTALFSLLGTTYGGDGKSTFALPNLQGSGALQQGHGPGLTLYDLGESTGTTAVSLSGAELPMHNHLFAATTNAGTTENASNNQLGVGATGTKVQSNVANLYSPNPGQATTAMSPQAIRSNGSSAPHNNMMPYLTLNFNIAMQGVFPSRP